MASDLWRWADPNGQQRKVRLDELRAALASGVIAPNTPVWRQGFTQWQPAHDVPELSSASVGGHNGVVLNIPPPPLAIVAVQQAYESSSVAPPPPQAEPEPPPPPRYVPIPAAAGSSPVAAAASEPLKTQIGGSINMMATMQSAAVPAKPASPGLAPTVSMQQQPSPGALPTLVGAPATVASPMRELAATTQPMPNVPATARMGPSLPTTIGVPPPPELQALAAASRVPRPPPTQLSPAVQPPPPADVVEEISGSILLDAGSQPDIPPSPNGRGLTQPLPHLPAPTDPIVHDDPLRAMGSESRSSLFEAAGIPRKPGLSLILDDIAAIRQGKPPRNKLLVGVLAFVALLLVILIISLIVSLFTGGSSTTPNDKKLASSASATGSSAKAPASVPSPSVTIATSATAPPTSPPPEPKGNMLGDCTVSGESKTIAPRVQIQSGIEAHPLGTGLALGFASSPRDAVATLLDSSLSPTSTVRAKPIGGDAKRVTPMLVNGKLTPMVDVDKKGDRITGRRVASGGLIDVGAADGNFVWAPHGRDSVAKLFALDGDGPIEALRAIGLPDHKGIVFAFRRGNTIHVGAAKGDSVLEPDGELSKIAGLGGQVGSPSIATSGGQTIVAWADRAGASDDWGIRWTKMKTGASAPAASMFTVPEGGLGGQAMSPSLASLGGGRFLLAWTEGPVSNHQVRAIVMGSDGLPSGSALSISATGVNAGQPAAVVGPDGHGAVAFIAAKGRSLEVHATPIHCPPR